MAKQLLFLLSLFFIVLGCSEVIDVQDTTLLNPTLEGEFRTDTLYATFDTTYHLKEPVNTSIANRILIGQEGPFACRPMLKFADLPENARIHSARVRLIGAGASRTEAAPFNAVAYPILQNWESNLDSNWQDLASMVDFSHPIGSLEVTAATEDTVYLELTDTALVQQWADTALAGENHGFFLDFSSASFIQKFYSRVVEQKPVLELSYRFPGDTAARDTTVEVAQNAFLIESQFQPVANRNHLVSLDRWVTVLQFPMASLLEKYPTGLVITTANVQVAVDWNNTLMDPQARAKFRMVRLQSQPEDGAVKADSNFLFFSDREVLMSLSEDSNFVQVSEGFERQDFTRVFVRAKLASPKDFTAFLLDVRTPGDFASHFSLYKRQEADPDRRPRLILELWIPPPSRF